jgi:hypothetical protein
MTGVIFIPKITFAAQPVITSAAADDDGTYTTGQCVNWAFRLDQYIDVTTGDELPSIDVRIGTEIKSAPLASFTAPGASFSEIGFAYCVDSTDVDSDGIEIFSPIKLNGSTIQSDPGGEDLVLTFTPLDSSGIIMNPDHPEATVLSPLDNATDVAVGVDLVMTFDEAVTIETGNIILKKVSDNTTVYTIDITGGEVTGGGTNTITISPDVNLFPGLEYYVLIDVTAFDDGASNSYTGISDPTMWTFTTAESGVSDVVVASPEIATINEDTGTQVFTFILTEPIIVPGGQPEGLTLRLISSDDTELVLSTNTLRWERDDWAQERFVTVTGIDDDQEGEDTADLLWVVDSASELYAGRVGSLSVTLVDDDVVIENAAVEAPSRSSSRRVYGCNDKKSINYKRFSGHKQELCKYSPLIIQQNNIVLEKSGDKSPAVVLRDLEFGLKGEDVKLLQQILNNNGYSLSEEGVGSLGNETMYFGDLTRKALVRYQKANNIFPSIGYCGTITRATMKESELRGVWW